jgi:membrane protein required for colicin V production
VNTIDFILVIFFLLFGLRGYFKGFFREAFSLAGLTVGFIAAVRYNQAVAPIIEEYWKVSPFILKGVSFVGIFFIVYFLFNLFGWFLHHSQRLLFLQTLNRAAGVVIGLLKGVAVMGLAISFMDSSSWLPLSAREKIAGSIFVPFLVQLGDGILQIGKERIFPIYERQTQVLGDIRFASFSQ